MDAHAVTRLGRLDEALRQTRADYQNRERLRGDVADLLRECHTLQPRSGSFSSAGRTVDLFYLYGVLPISYKGAEYNVPITVYFDQPYPKQAPRCFVTPSPGMALRKGHQHVDEGGMIHLPYLSSWKERSSTLTELITLMSSAFSVAPPVYSTGAAAAPRRGQRQGTGTGASPQPGRGQPVAFGRARRDVLLQDVEQALRDRWSGALQPVLAELQEQCDAQERLASDDPSGLSEEPDGQQISDSLAEELALDELLVALDELLAGKKITLEDFLREVREAGRRQFMCRAQRLKSASVVAAAAPAPDASDRMRQPPHSGQQALRATAGGGLSE
eukprot:CAMPEP_0171267084 /NCGR_PEP_ID=MMETSP0790-20130122/58977_1 /TAXON_ID=2925 /ORGANISM="Alexandrium catenella, Strain OF101" /LENGTH=330 /DNA_ID=CAMNT_0011735811 /DNA_START=27 /DNA_END=1017 /DNA_ORIENTATION=+